MQTMMLLLLAASPVQADLQAMEQSDGAAYLSARARVISAGALAEVEARRAQSKYEAATWRADVIADAAHFWLTRASDAERVYRLEGLDPTTYRLRRRPAPEAGRELARMNADPILFELLLKTMDRYPLTTEQERVALEDAVVVALGRSSHPAAQLALLDTAKDHRRRASLRGLAAAQLRSEETLLALLSEESFEVRSGAVQGLSEVRTPSSVRALIAASEDRTSRLPAIRALGAVASPFVLARSANPHAETIRIEASRAIVSLLVEDAPLHADALVETLALIRHPSALAELAKAEQTELVARAQRRLERALRR